MSKERKIELKSEDINDILSRPPRWIIRWGNFLMIVIVISLFAFGANFKFSDNIRASVSISGVAGLKGTLVLTGSKVERVRLGQDVNIMLRAYPYIEYGSIEAEVSGIKLLPAKAGEKEFYAVELIFPHGLKTNQGLILNTETVLDGEAEIITAETSVLEKIYNPLKNIFK
jgi:hypothetical protein